MGKIKTFLFLLTLLFVDQLMAKDLTRLENKYLRLDFNNKGIIEIFDKEFQKKINITDDQFMIKIDDEVIDGSSIKNVIGKLTGNRVTFFLKKGKFDIKVIYDLQRDWKFVSKQLFITVEGTSDYRVNEIEMIKVNLKNKIFSELLPENGRNGAFIRLADNSTGRPSYGIFFALQNPFMLWHRDNNIISVKYNPEMDWEKNYGIFKSDRIMIGVYKLSGQTYPVTMIPEWNCNENPRKEVTAQQPQIDFAEINTLSNCVQAFLLYKPKKSLRLQVGWTLNDYQIDVSNQEGRKTYKRIIDQAASLGIKNILYTPANSDLSSLDQNQDAWGWENVLWLGLGQKIREGEWNPHKDSVPKEVGNMIQYASSRGIGIVAYVYPTMPWMKDPKWTAWIKGKPGGYAGADNGIRNFQDWFIDLLISFYKRTGIKGYSFDHWWMRYDQKGTTSQYSQWYGTRRILETLRKKIPDIVIDGRQQYQQMGPWTWLAGSYPHPLASDEQPQSFRPFPDLSWDRVSADRQRYASWWYRMKQYTPIQILPGYLTHQTQRFNQSGELERSPFRVRDWDYMGWKYSVLSAIGTAPMNLVINYIPARDTNEFKDFSETDKKWFRYWLDWPDKHFKYMHKIRPILNQPMIGSIDGTSAIIDNKGYLFLFNPNYREMNAKFKLDQSIGLESGKKFILKTLYPNQEGYVGAPEEGFWHYGQKVNLPLSGTQAYVYEIIPVDEIKKIILLNAKGNAALVGNKLILSEVSGPVGHQRKLSILIPKNTKVSTLEINGKNFKFKSVANVITAQVTFDGFPFDHSQQVGKYDSSFAGGKYVTDLFVPERIFDQLKLRKKDWPIPYTNDDLKATWLAPSRMLLFIQIAEPKDDMNVSITIDGKKINLEKAYSSVYPDKNMPDNTFLGFYADLSFLIKPEKSYKIEVDLPVMKRGQFQGLFFQNIETDYTSQVR